jgi:hypothetical protein
MNTNYTFPKFQYTKNGVSSLYLFFDNGDFLTIKNPEIMDISINVYDRLIRSHQGFNPVASSGYLKLRIIDKYTYINTGHSLYNEADFRKNRKQYIENRCVNESKITQICLFDSNNWRKVIHCNATAKMDGEFLVVEILAQPQMGTFESKNNNIEIKDVKKEDIFGIDLDFENCDSFYVYNDELQEVNLVLDNNLEWGASDLNRQTIGGYIIIKLDKNIDSRDSRLYLEKKIVTVADYEKRLCGKKGEYFHDICHLYIDYNNVGHGEMETECIDVNNIDFTEKTENSGKNKSKKNWFIYESGYSKKLKDGSIVIAFGKDAKTTIDTQFKQ